MFVKKNFLILLFLISNLLIILSIFYPTYSFGKVWFSIHANSLVGFQSYIEKNFDILSHHNVNELDLLIILLETNFILISGFILLVCTILIAIRLFN